MRFHKIYFLLAIMFFIIEVLIALYVHDDFIRPYFGDFLVVILIYCFLMAFVKLPVTTAAISVLLFSYAIEALQYLNFIKHVGLENNYIARMVIGNSFSWLDIFWYTAGVLFIVVVERMNSKRREKMIF